MIACKRSTILALPLGLLLTFSGINSDEQLRFPDGFLFGTSTASYQIEGAWNESGKSENVWDRFTHRKPSPILDGSTADVTADSYHKWREDVQLLKDLGGDTYRFSLSWSRILPSGFANQVNPKGINYYKNLIDELRANDIEPMVTLYHWDHPQVIEEMGGWINELTVDLFVDYARVIFKELGSKIKYFITINEPSVVCEDGYENGSKAPGKYLGSVGKYECMHNMLKAHARVYHMYHNEFREQQKGLISISLPCGGIFSKHGDDEELTDLAFQMSCGWMAHPIFSKTGDYPEIMKQRVAENSKLEGYPRSRLPEFSTEWIEYIKKTFDYFSLNHYTSHVVEAVPHKAGELWYNDQGLKLSFDPKWPTTVAPWLRVVPEGLRQLLNKIKTEYDNPVVFITENGFPDKGTLHDTERIDYLYGYLKATLQSIHTDGCNVKAYYLWSLLDNFEWAKGYTNLFGIVHVDFNSPNRTRTPKLSMSWYKNLISTRILSTQGSNEIFK